MSFASVLKSLFITDIFVCKIAKCLPCYVKYMMNESLFHLGETAEETGG